MKNSTGNVNQSTTVRIFNLVTALAGFTVLVVATVPSAFITTTKQSTILLIRLTGIEISVLLFAVWLPQIIWKREANTLVTHKRNPSLLVLQVTTICLALFSTFFSKDYMRPLLFFPVIMLFYFLLFLEVFRSNPSPTSFLLKLIIGQALLMESLAFMYPGFLAVDSYRDFAIARVIEASAGGLPTAFVYIPIWYNVTPMLPLTYVSINLLTGLPLRTAELLIGFVMTTILTIGTGLLTLALSKNIRYSLLAIWFCSLVPSIWIWSTWPIPEIMALALFVICLAIILGDGKSHNSILAIILTVVIVLTHGGIALALIGVALVIFLLNRDRVALHVLIIGGVFFASYTVLASSGTAISGLQTIVLFLQSLFKPVFSVPQTSSNLYQGALAPLEAVSYTYWWVFLGVFGWIGLMTLADLRMPKRRAIVSLVVLSYLGILFSFASGILNTTSTDVTRYIALIGYPILCASAAFGLFSVARFPLVRKFFIPILVIALVFSGISNAVISPDLWQSLGQNSYATNYRVQYTTSYEEQQSQIFLNVYDRNYLIAYNYIPEFVNLTYPVPYLAKQFTLEEHPKHYLVGVSPFLYTPTPPYIILYSVRASEQNFVNYSLLSNISVDTSDIIYSNPTSYLLFVP